MLSITMHCCLRYTVQVKKIEKFFLETVNKINNVIGRNVPKTSLTPYLPSNMSNLQLL